MLEAFTKTSLAESMISSLAISAGCIWIGYWMGAQETPIQAALWVLGGMASWSFFEYLIHRFLFHLSETAFKGSKRIQYVLHGVHHEYPNDIERILMPTLPKILLALPFFGLFYLFFGKAGSFFSSGFMMGYYIYSLMHYSMHRFKAPEFLKSLWAHHHLHHHFQDKGFGLSSTLWDHVFNTMPPNPSKQKRGEYRS